MFKQQEVIFMYTETPLHAGAGAGMGVVDLPIQRERYTGYPIIQASGVKGAIRDHGRQLSREMVIETLLREVASEEELEALRDVYLDQIYNTNDYDQRLEELKTEHVRSMNAVFGPEDQEGASEHGGALAFTEARVLLFPVRSLHGVFAWATCPEVLHRFSRLMSLMGQTPFNIPDYLAQSKAATTRVCPLVSQGSMIIEDYAFQREIKDDEVKTIAKWLADKAFPLDAAHAYWKDQFYKEQENGTIISRLVIMTDNDFGELVQLATETNTRIRRNPDTGTVQRGALWTEENLPVDTLLYTMAMTTDPKARVCGLNDARSVMDFLNNNILGQGKTLQLGGNESISRGLVSTTIYGGE